MNKIFVFIGLEVHCQLHTRTRLFSDSEIAADAPANITADRYTFGYPGTLPLLNKEAVYKAVKLALALNCKINKQSRFDRKHYFYYDLPKGYQITQNFHPLAYDGKLSLPDENMIKIQKLHIEEDAGKTIIKEDGKIIDFNRAGIALAEIVTYPDIKSPEDAAFFMKEIRNIAVILNLNKGNLQSGEIRCDANISVSFNAGKPGKKVEIKNLNSFKFIRDALKYEIKRQSCLLMNNDIINEETRTYDEKKKITVPMRKKEDTLDYRYIPEPDLPPLVIDKNEIEKLQRSMPRLPVELRKLLKHKYKISDKEAEILIEDGELLEYYFKFSDFETDAMSLFNAIFFNRVRPLIIKYKLFPEVKDVFYVLKSVMNQIIPKGKIDDILERVILEKKDARKIIEENEYYMINDENRINEIIQKVAEENKQQYESYQNGNLKLIGFLTGKVNVYSGGLANPDKVKEMLISLRKK